MYVVGRGVGAAEPSVPLLAFAASATARGAAGRGRGPAQRVGGRAAPRSVALGGDGAHGTSATAVTGKSQSARRPRGGARAEGASVGADTAP